MVVNGDDKYKGYDGDNHYFLKNKGVSSARKLNDYRTKKKDKNKEGGERLRKVRNIRMG